MVDDRVIRIVNRSGLSDLHTFLSSTSVREIAALGGDVSSMVSAPVQAALKRRFQELGEDGGQIVPMTSLRD